MDLPPTPAKGDVVIVEVRSPQRYVLRPFDGTDQLVYGAREEAAAQALSYAKYARVNVWYSPDGVRFELIDVFRESRSRGEGHGQEPVGPRQPWIVSR